ARPSLQPNDSQRTGNVRNVSVCVLAPIISFSACVNPPRGQNNLSGPHFSETFILRSFTSGGLVQLHADRNSTGDFHFFTAAVSPCEQSVPIKVSCSLDLILCYVGIQVRGD
ncbi:hypothetical protein XENORESO_020821, partial [Xenotaenia resolanae]